MGKDLEEWRGMKGTMRYEGKGREMKRTEGKRKEEK